MSSLNEYEIHKKLADGEHTRESYWSDYALKNINWKQFPKTILDKSNPPFYRWFKDAQVNVCYNAVDRHLKDLASKPALIYESNMVNISETYTYAELYDNVSKLAYVLDHLEIKMGDRVIIYMPMIPEAVFSMLACARIGAIHSVVFGGFAAKELAGRIMDAKPSLIISASCGLEPQKIIDYKSIVDEALLLADTPDLKTIIVQRTVQRTSKIRNGLDLDYHTLMKLAKHFDCVNVPGDHPLYILYTSGTTGQPKGIVRDTAGTLVALHWNMTHINDIRAGDTYFSSSDIGWVVGHSFIVYGPLIVGAATVIYEGKPVGTPDPGAYWRIVEKHKVSGFYTAPTALRALRKEDLEGDWIKKYDIKTLRTISFAGERCDIPTFDWISRNIPHALINDNYWQTETGWIISCNYANLYTFHSRPGTCTKPCPGFQVTIVNEETNQALKCEDLGRVCIKLPLPPSFMLTLWNNDEAFVQKYLSDVPGYYVTGDAGYFDSDGYLHVMTRMDDIINTAGHRLSTAAMEEVLMGHNEVVEAAVVATKDELKGEIPVGFVVLKPTSTSNHLKLEKELANLIRKEIGPVACFKNVLIVDKLPKTRSGKILRYILKKILDGKEYKVPPTIEDMSVLEKLQMTVAGYGGFGKFAKIFFEEDIPGSPLLTKLKDCDNKNPYNLNLKKI